ncbi:MAG: formylglycine-generating enzyme family protein [Limnospira sp.]
MDNDQRQFQSSTRRQFIRLASQTAIGFFGAGCLSDRHRPENLNSGGTPAKQPNFYEFEPPEVPKNLPLQRVSFETVRVDPQGNINWRQELQGQFFSESLGENIAVEMILIPGGTFLMGSPETEAGRGVTEGPQHEVNVAPFFMSRYAITQKQWRAIANLPKLAIELDPDRSQYNGENRPAEWVTWFDAIEFCARLSQLTNRTYRLPSEAEWEYACRAGTATPFYYGETITTDIVNFYGDFSDGEAPKGVVRKGTAPVGSFPPNAFGLYDTHGNVWEWCADPWNNDYQGAPKNGRVWDEEKSGDRYQDYLVYLNDLIADNRFRVLRGGSWDVQLQDCRSAIRLRNIPTGRSNYGFRICCDIDRAFPSYIMSG